MKNTPMVWLRLQNWVILGIASDDDNNNTSSSSSTTPSSTKNIIIVLKEKSTKLCKDAMLGATATYFCC